MWGAQAKVEAILRAKEPRLTRHLHFNRNHQVVAICLAGYDSRGRGEGEKKLVHGRSDEEVILG